MRLTYLNKQLGQAMTEFVVSVSFVFLGLFVIIPMFGKVMDMQAKNQQAARYVVWERTVWFDQGDEPDESVQSIDIWESVATRNDEEIVQSMENRFFNGSRPGKLKPITADDTVGVSGQINPMWTYVQSKKTMYSGTTLGSDSDVDTGRYDGQLTPSIGYKIVDVINTGVEVIADPINEFLGFLGGDNNDFMTFAYETKNYFSPVITTQLNLTNSHGGGSGVWDRDAAGNWGSGIEDVIFSNWNGALTSRTAILADGWNTQSLKHYQQRADDFVPSTMFDNDVFDAAITVASLAEGGPDNSAVNKLDFGAVGIEPMPANPEADGGGPMDVTEGGALSGGFYFYDD